MVMLGRCNVAAVEPQIYGVKKMVSIFHVLINRPIKIDNGRNGDDHREKLDTKHTQPTLFTRNVKS